MRQVPGPEFPAPTAMIWLDMAALVNGGRLAPHILPFCVVAALCAAVLPGLAFLLQHVSQAEEGSESSRGARLAAHVQHWLPSGIGFAVRPFRGGSHVHEFEPCALPSLAACIGRKPACQRGSSQFTLIKEVSMPVCLVLIILACSDPAHILNMGLHFLGVWSHRMLRGFSLRWIISFLCACIEHCCMAQVHGPELMLPRGLGRQQFIFDVWK